MDVIEIIAQGAGILATVINVISYQMKRKETMLLCHFSVCLLYCLNFFLLGAVVGGLTNLIGLGRSIVYMYRERLHSGNPAWLISFIVMYISAYILSFAVLGQEANTYNLIFGAIRILGAILLTVGYHLDGAKNIRRFSLITSPMFLIYGASVFSIGAVCTEIIKSISTVIGIIRFDKQKIIKKEN